MCLRIMLMNSDATTFRSDGPSYNQQFFLEDADVFII